MASESGMTVGAGKVLGVTEVIKQAVKSKPWYTPGGLFLSFAVMSVLLFSYTEGTNEYPKIFAGGLIALFIFNLVLKGKKLIISSEYKLILAWLIVGVISIAIALDSDLAMFKLATLGTVIPLSLAIFHFVLWQGSPKNAWIGVVLGTLAMCYLSLRSGVSLDDRLSGTAGNANQFGYVLVVSLIFSIYTFFSIKNPIFKLAAVAVAAALIYFIPLTGSKQALIGLFLAMFAYTVLKLDFKNARRASKSIAFILLFVAAMATAFFYVRDTPYFDRFVDFVDTAQSGKMDETSRTGVSTKYRYLMYKYGFDIATRYPVFGVGLDNFRLAVTEYPEFTGRKGSYSHSNYIEIMADTGFTGFFIYMAMYAALGLRLRRLRKRPLEPNELQLYHALVALYVVILVSDFSMVSYYDKTAWMVLATVIASAVMLENRQKERLTQSRVMT